MTKTNTGHKNYKRPPIREAVIEVRFADTITDSQLELLCKKQNKSTFTIQKVEVVLSPESKEHKSTRLFGFKLIENEDTANIIQFKHNAISVSRLAPYEGWDKLFENFKKYYEFYTKNKHRTISRIGVRFINRIDIPTQGKDTLKVEDYIKVYANVPNTKFPALSSSLVQVTSVIDDNRTITINSYLYENVLIDYLSFILDLDIARVKNLPVNSKILFEELKELREKKNFFFEMLTTAKCKVLFK